MNVIFDMDGVIFDTERFYIECCVPAAEKVGLADMEKVSYECIGLREEETKQKLLDHYGEHAPLKAFEEETFRIFRNRYQQEGLPLKKGVVELLSYLKERGARIAIGSSTRHDVVEMELRDAGLLDYFDALACGDMVEHSKPEPDVFLLAKEMLDDAATEEHGAAETEMRDAASTEEQGAAADCIIIEDSFNGVIAAKRAGATVFMVPDLLEPTEEIRAMADKVFYSLVEVKQWFEMKLEGMT